MKKLPILLSLLIFLHGCSEMEKIEKNDEHKSIELEPVAHPKKLPLKEPASKEESAPAPTSANTKQLIKDSNENAPELPAIEKTLKEIEEDEDTLKKMNSLEEKLKEAEQIDKEMNQEVLRVEELDEQLRELEELSSELDELEILDRELNELETLLHSLDE